METYKNLLIGVIGGIIATGIVGFIVLVFNKIIWPKIRELTYRGIDLADEWVCTEHITVKQNNTNQSVKRREYHLTLKQNGHRLSGDVSVKNIHPKTMEEDMSFFKTVGTVKDNYVQIDFTAKSKKTIGIGTFLFSIREGGRCLKGNLVATEKNTLDIISIDDLEFKRKN
jgi:hypothetical protein